MLSLVAETPVLPRGDNSVGALGGAQPECSKCVALCTTQNVHHGKLRPAQGIQRGVHRNSLALHRSNSLLAVKLIKDGATSAGRRSLAVPIKPQEPTTDIRSLT
jgi:hypothetical protein